MNNYFGCRSVRRQANGRLLDLHISSFIDRRIFLLTLIFLLHQEADAQNSSLIRSAWNGTDAVVHRPGDPPYSLYHIAKPYPHIRKPSKEITSYAGLYTGMWIPNGRNQVLGSHPLLGMMLGQWINRFNWQMDLEFQIGATNTPYTVIYQGQKTQSQKYGGNYLGLNFGYSLVTVKRSVFYLTAGIGGTGFVAIKGDDNNDALSINSFTKNIGVGYHHFDKKGNLIGVTVLYNFLDFQNPGGTPMDGNALTFRLVFAGFD